MSHLVPFALYDNANQALNMLKFNFSVKTRGGQTVNNILIAGKDDADAERKLRQMYYHCEITRCEVRQDESKHASAASIEELLSLICNSCP